MFFVPYILANLMKVNVTKHSLHISLTKHYHIMVRREMKDLERFPLLLFDDNDVTKREIPSCLSSCSVIRESLGMSASRVVDSVFGNKNHSQIESRENHSDHM